MADQDKAVTLGFTISVDGQNAGTQEFDQEMVTIGKGDAAVLQIADSTLADLHCAVQVGDDDAITVLDLGSEAGTSLNGEIVNNSVVKDGDELRLGKTVIKLVLSRPEAEEEDTDADSPAPLAGDVEPNEADSDAEMDNAEDAIVFVLRSGTADSDMGIDRKAPPVVEVAEIWGETVMNVRHFGPDHKAVFVGDRKARNSRVASAILTSVLVLGTFFFMMKHASHPDPVQVPEDDAALIARWDAATQTEKERFHAEKKAEREALRKDLEEEADARIAKHRSKYDRDAKDRHDKAVEKGDTSRSLDNFFSEVRE